MSCTTTSTKNDNDSTKVLIINVIYRPGKELVLADTLSRAFLQDDNDLIEEKFEVNTLCNVRHKDNGA